MKIRMKNQIQLDGQTELIDQIYDAEWTQKGSYHYLLFKNGSSKMTEPWLECLLLWECRP